MSGKTTSKQTGATFIELLLALFVLVASSSGLLGAYLSGHLLSEQARQERVAFEDLRDIMERIQSNPFATLAVEFPDGVTNGGAGDPNPYEEIAGDYTLPDQQITVTYPVVTADRMEILVTLTWTHRTRARTASVSTVRTSS
jgi:hypothetical protein